MSASISVRFVECFADEWQMLRARVVEVKAEYAEGRKVNDRKTIFYDILRNDQINPHDKDTERLVSEALTVVGAG